MTLIGDLLNGIIRIVASLKPLWIVAGIIVAAAIITKVVSYLHRRKSVTALNGGVAVPRADRAPSYRALTGNSVVKTWFDSGARGEYLIYKELSPWLDAGAKMLFNLYLPKPDGTTTEIDDLLINRAGIFVIESKFYSGWIFGNEGDAQWTQTLPAGRQKSEKNRFPNPVRQNKGHIAALQRIVGNDVPIFSVVVFSDRCELKKITVNSPDVAVIKRESLWQLVLSRSEKSALDGGKIDELYLKLYPYSQVSEDVKRKHIENIGRKT